MNRVLIPNRVTKELSSNIEGYRGYNERGGLLLGFRKELALQITEYTLPQKWDYATPSLFKRDPRGHRELANRAWAISGMKTDWIGEWHTHPGGIADPSMVDRRNWSDLSKYIKKPMVFVIFADDGLYVGLQNFIPKKLSQLESIEQDKIFNLFGKSEIE